MFSFIVNVLGGIGKAIVWLIIDNKIWILELSSVEFA